MTYRFYAVLGMVGVLSDDARLLGKPEGDWHRPVPLPLLLPGGFGPCGMIHTLGLLGRSIWARGEIDPDLYRPDHMARPHLDALLKEAAGTSGVPVAMDVDIPSWHTMAGMHIATSWTLQAVMLATTPGVWPEARLYLGEDPR